MISSFLKMGLEYIFHNIKVTRGYHIDRPDSITPIVIVGDLDFISSYNLNHRESCENYAFSRDLYVMETDFILVKNEDGINYIESFELKSSRNKSPYNYNIQRQLLKQALILGMSVMKGIVIAIEDQCYFKNFFGESRNLILNVKYLNGTEECSVKRMDIKDKIKYTFKNGHLISNILIEKENSDFNVGFHFVFDRFIYSDRFRISSSNLDGYLTIIFREYNKIVNLFLSNGKKITQKEKISLVDILNSFFTSQKTFQALEQ